jgi:hypothetical protein
VKFCVVARSKDSVHRDFNSLRMNGDDPLPSLNSSADCVSYCSVFYLIKSYCLHESALVLIQVFGIARLFLFAFFFFDQIRKSCAPTILGCALQQSLIALDLLVAAELVGELPLDEIVHGALLAVAGGSATGLSATDAWAWPLSVMGQHTLMGQQEANPSGAVPAQ